MSKKVKIPKPPKLQAFHGGDAATGWRTRFLVRVYQGGKRLYLEVKDKNTKEVNYVDEIWIRSRNKFQAGAKAVGKADLKRVPDTATVVMEDQSEETVWPKTTGGTGFKRFGTDDDWWRAPVLIKRALREKMDERTKSRFIQDAVVLYWQIANLDSYASSYQGGTPLGDIEQRLQEIMDQIERLKQNPGIIRKMLEMQ